MKPMQALKGIKLTANQRYNILDEFKAPIVAIQNQSGTVANVIFNDGYPMSFGQTPFAWEPLSPLYGTIETDGSDVVIFV
jgi:hypothetical protein